MDFSYLSEHLNCTYAEKKDCLSFVEIILDLAEICTEKTVLVIKEVVERDAKYDIPLLKKGASLILDGIDPDTIKNIVYNYIVFSNCTGKDFLKNIIIADTLILLDLGRDLYSVLNMVSSYFGIEFYDYFENILYMYDKKYGINIEQIEDKYKYTKPFSEETTILEPYLKPLSHSISAVKYIISNSNTFELSHALRGASGDIKILFLSNMFKRQRYMMNFHISKNTKYEEEGFLIYCQKQTLNIINACKYMWE